MFVDFLNPLQQGLVALQGPTAAKVLQSLTKIDLCNLKFMHSVKAEVADNLVRVSRCGYTGEDGFEISVPAKDAVNLVERILQISDVKLAGLGARDSLRYVDEDHILFFIRVLYAKHTRKDAVLLDPI